MKIWQEQGHFPWSPVCICYNISLNSSHNEKKFQKTKVAEKIKTHILCSITFSWKSCPLWVNVDKYVTARKVTGDNMAHLHRMLDQLNCYYCIQFVIYIIHLQISLFVDFACSFSVLSYHACNCSILEKGDILLICILRLTIQSPKI
jgi:hypothetical protein